MENSDSQVQLSVNFTVTIKLKCQ